LIPRPQLRRGRLAHLEQLDHQRPRVRLEKMAPPREQPGASWFVWCAIGIALCGIGYAATVVFAVVVRACS
jgi:hypothetical protein